MNKATEQTATHNDIALRIALATRVLPETNPQRLLRVLDDCIGLPLTQDGLDKLTPKMMKQAAYGDMSEVPGSMLRQAIEYLKGDAELNETPLPEITPYEDGDMADSIRIACATNGKEMIDGHFGSCTRYLIYQVSTSEIRLIDIRSALDADQAPGLDVEKPIRRADLIHDCDMVMVYSIEGPAAARATQLGVHSVKVESPIEAREKLKDLQLRLQSSPPRWMKRIG